MTRHHKIIMSIQQSKTQLTVIGAGPGGYAAAFRAADLEMEVTLIDADDVLGGVCLHRGCIPSKALLHVTQVLDEALKLEECGVVFKEPRIDLQKLKSWKEGVIGKLSQGLKGLAKQRKVGFIQGRASFLDDHTLRVICPSKGEIHLETEFVIIATGSRPRTLDVWPIDSPHMWNSTQALELNEIPENLLVIGGGYIGLELGCVYASLGSKVSLVEMTSSLLPGVDRDLVSVLSKNIFSRFENIYLNASVESIKSHRTDLSVSLKTQNQNLQQNFDKVLYAIGRLPNSSGLGLEHTSVETDDRGFIVVDEQRRTHQENIFAIGDVAGEPGLAHKAAHEARVAVEAILGESTTFMPRAIPAVVFTNPEVAWCGFMEKEAKKEGYSIKVLKFPWQASGKAICMGTETGLTKMIVDQETEQILGVGLVGLHAGEMISEAVLALEMGATPKDLSLTIHPHPTLSETIMESAEMFYGRSVHL